MQLVYFLITCVIAVILAIKYNQLEKKYNKLKKEKSISDRIASHHWD